MSLSNLFRRGFLFNKKKHTNIMTPEQIITDIANFPLEHFKTKMKEALKITDVLKTKETMEFLEDASWTLTLKIRIEKEGKQAILNEYHLSKVSQKMANVMMTNVN